MLGEAREQPHAGWNRVLVEVEMRGVMKIGKVRTDDEITCVAASRLDPAHQKRRVLSARDAKFIQHSRFMRIPLKNTLFLQRIHGLNGMRNKLNG